MIFGSMNQDETREINPFAYVHPKFTSRDFDCRQKYVATLLQNQQEDHASAAWNPYQDRFRRLDCLKS